MKDDDKIPREKPTIKAFSVMLTFDSSLIFRAGGGFGGRGGLGDGMPSLTCLIPGGLAGGGGWFMIAYLTPIIW